MRLDKIKLAGFKSFVDPITIPISGNLIGIVGPNGCGKSNIIDAVRWVMGESSAKHLRGDKMADVIFNGSSARKPVAMASVELIFDNQENPIGGEFANYNTLSVKRQVSRDGQSVYLLNSTRCRRKDITDLFLGTGVGSRSYAIIEQGMIARLIEAKPDELRELLEEAAGISKYKERRRETALRMGHTRENLDRLEDVRDEVSKQLNHLKRQAKKAEKFKFLKQEQRTIKQELLAMRWRSQDQKHQQDSEQIQSLNETLKGLLLEQQRVDKSQEEGRESIKKQQQVLNEIQGEFYEIGSEISRLEQTIKHARASREALKTEVGRLNEQSKQIGQDLDQDKQQLKQIQGELDSTQTKLIQCGELETELLDRQNIVVEQHNKWQIKWDDLNDRRAVSKEQVEVQRARIEQLEKQEEYFGHRFQRLVEEQTEILSKDCGKTIPVLEETLSQLISERQDIQSKLETDHQEIEGLRQHLRTTFTNLNERRNILQTTNGKISSLEMLQKHALGKDQKATRNWLKKMALEDAPRLSQFLEVKQGWENAVEIVLDTYLEAVCLGDITSVLEEIGQIGDGTLTIFDTVCQHPTPPRQAAVALVDRIQSPWNLSSLLSGVYCADNLDDAVSMVKNLKNHESVIVQEGVWQGPGWVIVKKRSNKKFGVLQREKELRALTVESQSVHLEIEGLESKSGQLEEQQRRCEKRIQDFQQQLDRLNRQISDHNARLSADRTRYENTRSRLKQIESEQEEIRRQQSVDKEDIAKTRDSLAKVEQEKSAMEWEKQTLSDLNEKTQKELREVNAAVFKIQNEIHEIKNRIGSLKSSETLTQKHLNRIEQQYLESIARRKEIETGTEQSSQPLDSELEQLEQYKNSRSKIEKSMKSARNQLETLELNITEIRETRIRTEREIEKQREYGEKARVEMQTARVRRQTLEEQLQEMSVDAQSIAVLIPDNADEKLWQEKLENLSKQIERLGTINLTAVEEYESQEQRLNFLNGQHKDLVESLSTLEEAIKKIDHESKKRFKITFDQVNDGLKDKFPLLFGGGDAHLELRDENLLDSGVAVMARPPGKRNTSIHLLSGGEKALTAVALVFAIFELNPAPFCLLDEVDAPLDDPNVVRFSQLILQMSERIQFLFVTHNKVTMEIAEQLTGITMNEPGVSRMVAVDIDDAVKMAV